MRESAIQSVALGVTPSVLVHPHDTAVDVVRVKEECDLASEVKKLVLSYLENSCNLLMAGNGMNLWKFHGGLFCF